MKRQIFHDASVKLAGTYLIILMALSLVFSVSLYQVLTNEFDKNLARNTDILEHSNRPRPDQSWRDDFLLNQINNSRIGKNRIERQLVVLNLFILVFGGGICYWLARRSLEPIERSHLALERFTSDASHELRTPLTAMQTEIEVALMNPKLDTKSAKNLLQSNLEEVNRLGVLSERLLVLARLDEHELPKEPVLVSDILAQAVKSVQPMADAKSIKIKRTLDSKTKNLQFMADKTSIIELIIILLDNAVKYSGDKSQVELTVESKHNKLYLKVSDKGPGINEQDLPHIFKRFYRADQSRTKNTQHGYGLGLALADKIARIHGGDISVKSSPSSGSDFIISLPLVS